MRDKSIWKILAALIALIVMVMATICISLCTTVGGDSTDNTWRLSTFGQHRTSEDRIIAVNNRDCLSSSAEVAYTSGNIKLYLLDRNLSEYPMQSIEGIKFIDGSVATSYRGYTLSFISEDGKNWTWGNYFLGGDINGTSYSYKLLLGSYKSTTFKIEIIINGTTVATFPLLTVPYDEYYQPFSGHVTGLDPTTSSGDEVILKITKISGSTGSIIYPETDSYITIPPLAYDEIWVGNTSYGGEVWFNVSEGKIRTFRISTKGVPGDVINITTGKKEGRCVNERVVTYATNATIINNQFTYSSYYGKNVTELSGVFTSDRDVNGTWKLQIETPLPNFTCIYPLISWNATKVYAPSKTLSLFDTVSGTYPSIMGTHKGEIKPSCNITVSKLYTYPCPGTGGHTESIELYENDTLIANGTWEGYAGDWHNITLHNVTGAPYVRLLRGHRYNYTIVTGSYPQIIHEPSKEVTGGNITCSSFVDANGKVYYDWIPAIKLE